MKKHIGWLGIRLCRITWRGGGQRPARHWKQGHTEAILFSTYRELVTPKAAKAYWAIMPVSLPVSAKSLVHAK